MREKLRVALIGAASPQWGYGCSRDLIVALSGERICSAYKPVLVMEDVDGTNLELQVRLAKRVAAKMGRRVTVESTTKQREALTDARFVVVTFAVGTLEAMQYDVDIPMEYGIFQPVGDTISIGGAIRAARNIPAMISIARDIEKHGHPNAWLLNLANPMSTLCRAVTRETRVKTVGCCHELYGGLYHLATLLKFDYGTWRDSMSLELLGINHCGWLKSLKVKRRDGLEMLRKYLEKRGYTSEQKQVYDSATPDLVGSTVKMNLFLRHGVFPYSGDRHNVEFFREFVNEDTNMGADYGVLLTSVQERLVTWRAGARATVQALLKGKQKISLDPSQEAASKIIPALLLGEPFYDVGNLPYRGEALPGVPQGAVLETLATYDKNGATPDPVTPLPPALHEHLVLHCGIIEDVVEASVTGNRRRLVRAMRRDPLLENMNPRKIPELVGRLLAAHREYVHPGFF